MKTKVNLKENKRYLLTGVSALCVLSLILFAAGSALIPAKYLVLLGLLCLAAYAGLFFLQRRWSKGSFAIAAAAEILLIALSCYGMSVFYHAGNMMNRITEPVTETESISAYVLTDSSLQSIEDAAKCRFGKVSGQSEETVNRTLDTWEQEVGVSFLVQPYDDLFAAADALKEKSVQVLVLNDAYAGIIGSVEGYEWFDEETRVLSNVLAVTQVQEENQIITSPEPEETLPAEEPDKPESETKKDEKKEEEKKVNMELMEEPEAVDWSALVNQELLEAPSGAFVLYISGADTWGKASTKSRSDVNILAVVNTNTKKILLVSTPRDYYVPLSVSRGVKDKLTHAGIYGINTSVETLEMLYGVDIRYYVRMNFTGFVGIVDALGGVDVYSDSDFTVGDAFSYTQGINHMDGIQALAFARERHSFAGGDRARGTHQMEVIKAVVNKCASSAILYNYSDVMNSISGCFTTNMSHSEIAALVRMQLGDMAQWSITSMSVDGTGDSKTTYTVPGKRAYVMIPDESTVQKAKESIAAVLSGE